MIVAFFFFQAEDGIRDLVRSRGLGDVYKRQSQGRLARAVRPDEGDLGALADPQMDITQQRPPIGQAETHAVDVDVSHDCLLYTSDAADERSSVDLGGRRIIKKNNKKKKLSLKKIRQTNRTQYQKIASSDERVI